MQRFVILSEIQSTSVLKHTYMANFLLVINTPSLRSLTRARDQPALSLVASDAIKLFLLFYLFYIYNSYLYEI